MNTRAHHARQRGLGTAAGTFLQMPPGAHDATPKGRARASRTREFIPIGPAPQSHHLTSTTVGGRPPPPAAAEIAANATPGNGDQPGEQKRWTFTCFDEFLSWCSCLMGLWDGVSSGQPHSGEYSFLHGI